MGSPLINSHQSQATMIISQATTQIFQANPYNKNLL